MNKNRLYIASLIIALCIIGYAAYWLSTKSSRTLRNEIIGMQGIKVELIFPDAEIYHTGLKTKYDKGNGNKLVVFVDSLSCSSCFLNKLINYYDINDSLVKNNGQLVIILNPKNSRIDEIRRAIVNEKYPFWCIIDKKGGFLHRNPEMPDNELLHTFLLDENDNIILVGDPSYNPKINKLLMKQLTKQ